MSDQALRHVHLEGPFAITAQIKNADRLICLNRGAETTGLQRGMGVSEARALCPDLRTTPHNPQTDAWRMNGLIRWIKRYCPWVGQDGTDGLLLDITGSSHLFGGEAAMVGDMQARLTHSGLSTRIGVADTRGAAWALAHYAPGIAPPGQTMQALASLPVAALRISEQDTTTLLRLGLKQIMQLAGLPRATLGQRFGPAVLMRLDQALGAQGEQISPQGDPPSYTARLTFPEPIGLAGDIMAGVERLLPPICDKLIRHEAGARNFRLTCRRVDGADQQISLRLARPLRDPQRIRPLFERGIAEIDAGFGIDQLRLEAVQVEDLPVEQITHRGTQRQDGVHDLITRLGNRIGLENIQRFLPADSHIPERSFVISAAAWSDPEGAWPAALPRPLRLFAPEPVLASGRCPPRRFRWRRMLMQAERMTGPERIAPEWWLEDENWRSGLRDYWKVETRQGRRLWMFHTPQNPGWYVHGEFA